MTLTWKKSISFGLFTSMPLALVLPQVPVQAQLVLPEPQRDIIGGGIGNLASVDKIQYFEPGTGFVDCPETLYVPVGTTVTFKALPGAGETFAVNAPSWSGTGGVQGTGETFMKSFTTPSATLDDVSVIRARSKNWRKIRVITFELKPRFTAQDVLPDRVDGEYGIGELLNLDFTTLPAGLSSSNLGGLQWTLEAGDGSLNDSGQSDGSGTFSCPEDEGDFTLGLQMNGGAGKGQRVNKSGNAGVPTGTYIKSQSSTLWHISGEATVGFVGDWYLLPKNRSFSKLGIREGAVTATGNDITGIMHRLSTAQRTHDNDPVFSACVPPAGGEGTKVTGWDSIGGLAPDPQNQGYAGGGTFTWNIPWFYCVMPTPANNPGKALFTVKHYFTCDHAGTTTITKHSPTYTRTLNAASTTPNGWMQ